MERKGMLQPLSSSRKIKKVKSLPKNVANPMMLKVVRRVNSTTNLGSIPSIVPATESFIPSSLSPATNPSHMHLVQTADGRKLLLTNVVNVSKAMPSKPLIFLSKGQNMVAPAPSTTFAMSSAPRVTPQVSANMPQTIIINPTQLQAPQPVVLRIPGINQPIVVRQQSTNPMAATSQPAAAPKRTIATSRRATPAPTTTTAAVPGPITSPAKALTPEGPIMFVNSGMTKFKVVGKPVPVQLFPKVQNIAPKDTSTTTTFAALPASLPSLKSVRKVPDQVPPLITVPAGPPKAPLPEPPAYLNIRVKEEPAEQGGGGDAAPAVKMEPADTKQEDETDEEGDLPLQLDALLDVRIKEEATDEQSELLARDKQLRQVLGVTNTDDADEQQQNQHQQEQLPPQMPKFYIRTSEGKLVSISPEEAKALGLNHKDKVEENQRRLMNALSMAQTTVVDRGVGAEMAAKLRPDTPNVLIPGNVNVKDFVSCHVSPAAEKTAALMRNLAGRRLDTNANNILAPKSNTGIIGEFEAEDGKRYLKITIETEANGKEPCNVPITPLNTYQCPFCGRDFKTKDHVVSHIRIHTGERPYPCDVCGKRYRQRIDIIRHMRIHTGEKPFNCGLCNASFNQKSNLRSHMRIHTGERPVQCKVCGKGFSRNTHLKQHMKLHTGEKPYKCNVCHRPFRFKSGLQAHERIHTGLKPYACSLCGRTFTQIVGLIRHERTHAGEKPFRCQSCGKSFDTRDALKSHVKKHTGERPHACDLCPKTFTDPSALRCHRKKYHANMLICVICLREDFKDRIELREHLRAHERQNWEETPEGELVPLARPLDGEHFISVNDMMDEDETLEGEGDENYPIQNEVAMNDENYVEVELDPDDPMEDDSESRGFTEDRNDGDNDYREHKFQIEDCDPLA